MNASVVLQGVRKRFGSTEAVRGIDLAVPSGCLCGVLGPKSNAHGPNEFLHVPYAKKLTAAVAQVIAAAP
jgi:ABC-type uncharacterized transport system ATPase subunit